MSKPKNPAAVALGRISTPKKAQAARENGKKGGRPKRFDALFGRVVFDVEANGTHTARLPVGIRLRLYAAADSRAEVEAAMRAMIAEYLLEQPRDQ